MMSQILSSIYSILMIIRPTCSKKERRHYFSAVTFHFVVKPTTIKLCKIQFIWLQILTRYTTFFRTPELSWSSAAKSPQCPSHPRLTYRRLQSQCWLLLHSRLCQVDQIQIDSWFQKLTQILDLHLQHQHKRYIQIKAIKPSRCNMILYFVVSYGIFIRIYTNSHSLRSLQI